jgi:hypothetical protein
MFNLSEDDIYIPRHCCDLAVEEKRKNNHIS